MPFGTKPDASGNMVDFDAVYWELIKPAIEEVARLSLFALLGSIARFYMSLRGAK